MIKINGSVAMRTPAKSHSAFPGSPSQDQLTRTFRDPNSVSKKFMKTQSGYMGKRDDDEILNSNYASSYCIV